MTYFADMLCSSDGSIYLTVLAIKQRTAFKAPEMILKTNMSARFQAFAEVKMRSLLFWDDTERRLVVGY
jgi:hypothetical protein